MSCCITKSIKRLKLVSWKAHRLIKYVRTSNYWNICRSLFIVCFLLSIRDVEIWALDRVCSVSSSFSLFLTPVVIRVGFPCAQWLKSPSGNAGDTTCAGSVPGLGRSPGGWHGKLLQWSSPGNLTDRGACWATVPGVAKSRTQLSDSKI